MTDYDLINVTVSRFLDRYVANISWKEAESELSPFWGGSRTVDLPSDLSDLEAILQALAEELYNVSPHVGKAGAHRESPADPRGGRPTLPEAPFD